MKTQLKILFLGICFVGSLAVTNLSAESEPPVDPPSNLLFRDQFYLGPETKISHDLQEASGFNLMEQISEEWDSNFAVVTGFAERLLRTQALKGIKTVDDASVYIRQYEKRHSHRGVTIRELPILRGSGDLIQYFWVGDQSFTSLGEAKEAIERMKSEVEGKGGSFDQALSKALEERPLPPLEEKKAAVKKPRFEEEEELAYKVARWLGFDRHYLGRLGGIRAGEPVLYQSTFESTYRFHNLDQKHFDAVVGFYSHRVVLQGFRFLNETTIDPYVEAIPVGETNGKDFATYLELAAGLEWRPFIQSAFLQNFRPYGMALLDWIRSYRVYIAYAERKPLKEPFSDADQTFDLEAGVTIFKEWGVELAPITEQKPSFPRSLFYDLLWGEYFGEYIFKDTNFSPTDDYDSFSTTTALRVGLKFPKIPLPENPVNDEFVFMPYFILEDVRSSSQGGFSDNKTFWGFGVRWMPFRSYRFTNTEWLFKTKLFFEYINDISYWKGKPDSEVPETDYRIGINVSLRRF